MFILASSSVSRLEILQKLNLIPEFTEAPSIEEAKKKNETPKMLSLRLAKEKGMKIAIKYPTKVVLSADTVVCIGRSIIDKCESEEEVKTALQALSGRSHRVFTTVCTTLGTKQRYKTVETRVKFKRLTSQEIENYAKSGEGIGKAGGYTISGFAESFIIQITGSVSGVIGLPSYETVNLLKSYKIYH